MPRSRIRVTGGDERLITNASLSLAGFFYIHGEAADGFVPSTVSLLSIIQDGTFLSLHSDFRDGACFEFAMFN